MLCKTGKSCGRRRENEDRFRVEAAATSAREIRIDVTDSPILGEIFAARPRALRAAFIDADAQGADERLTRTALKRFSLKRGSAPVAESVIRVKPPSPVSLLSASARSHIPPPLILLVRNYPNLQFERT